MSFKKGCLIVCFILMIKVPVFAFYDYGDVGKIIEGQTQVVWFGFHFMDAFVYIDPNYLEVVYYYPFREVMETVGAEVIWDSEHGSIKMIYDGAEYYVELEQLEQEPTRGILTMHTLNEGGANYITLNEEDSEHYMNYIMYDNSVFISMRPDLINVLEQLSYSAEVSREYNKSTSESFREFTETIGVPSLYLYPNPREIELDFYFKKDETTLLSPALFIDKRYFYVPMVEILEIAGVQMDWFKLPWEYDAERGYYVFRGNRDIPPLACFWYSNKDNFILVLYEEEDREYLNYSHYYRNEGYERFDSKTLLVERMYVYNNEFYIEVESMNFILNYFGNYKIYADEENKTVHMERKGLKTP